MADLGGPERGCLTTLEFDVICRVAANLADSEPGKRQVLALAPSGQVAEVRARLAQTVEMSGLVAAGAMPSLAGAMDVEDLAARLAPDGAVAAPEELVSLMRHLRVAHDARKAVLAAGDAAPELGRIAESMATFPALLARLQRTFEDDGHVKDGASTELERLRRRMEELDRRVRRVLDQMLSRSDVVDALSEALVTVREDRLVLPVKAERRSRIPGVLRGRSSSGQTVFVEPQAIVGLGDERRDLVEEERKEILRILRELGQEIRPELPHLVACAARVALLDVVKAKARLGLACRGTVPRLEAPDMAWEIREGRHPLLDPALRPLLGEAGIEVRAAGDVVPVSIALAAGQRSLVLTGPNTGGKTATLKLVGLLHVMAQAGMLVPAGEGSVLSVFRTILADIGDEQSLTQSLSTFSSHMARIAGFFADLALPALVVLDELGAGTDPREGEALGLAILQELSRRGARVVASTHYGAIKSWALASPDVTSIAMEWDEATLRPTYRLSAGASGASHALPIARRLAMDGAVLESAQAILDRGQTAETRRVEDLTRELHAAERERERLLEERAELKRTMATAEAHVAELRAREARLGAEGKQVLADARRRVRGILAYVEEQSGKLLAEATQITPAQARKRRKEIMEHASEELAAVLPEGLAEASVEPAAAAEMASDLVAAPGLRALHRGLGMTGSILEVRDGRVHVDVQGKRLWVKPGELRVLPAAAPVARAVVRAAPRDEEAVPLELSLLGMRVEEAMDAAERYLDRAATTGLPAIRIVHGFGTGRLRDAVRQLLKGHPLVKEFRAGEGGEGGGGATVVTLR